MRCCGSAPLGLLYCEFNFLGATFMTEPYLGELRVFGFKFAPKGWAACDGALLSIASNKGLYSLLGTSFGGDGNTTFALPDLRGRMPVGIDPRDESFVLGSSGGAEAVTLSDETLAPHSHRMRAASVPPTTAIPINAAFAPVISGFAVPPSNSVAMTDLIDPAGDGAAHDTMQPFTTFMICIATSGIFPSRN